jgi:general nucleoside transport system permease protein
LKPTISPGYGFTAIIVAFLGRLSPFGILLAGLVLALVSIGAEGAQVALKLPLDLARVFQGLLLFCILGADILSRYRVVLMRER